MTRCSASRIAASTRPNLELTSQRASSSVTSSTAALSTNSATRICGVAIGMPRMRLKSVKPLLPPKPVSLRKNSSMRGVGQRLGDDREVHALDARAEREAAEHVGEQPRHQHHQRRAIPEMLSEAPVPGIRLPVEEHHEVRQLAVVDAVARRSGASGTCPSRSRPGRRTAPWPEREDARVAPHQVHRQRHDRVADDLAAQARPSSRTGAARCPPARRAPAPALPAAARARTPRARSSRAR